VPLKTAGIIGGIGPESTIDYYRLIVASYRERASGGAYPPIVINCIDLRRLLDLIEAGELARLTDFLAGEIARLARAGADFGLLAANTPHIVFDELRRRSPLPLLSIVEATRDAAKSLGMKTVGLFGARFTMQGRFYPDVFEQAGMTLVTPTPDEQAFIHDRYMTELVNGLFPAATRERFVSIARRLSEQAGIDGLILGGTELPLLMRGVEVRGVPFLDTTKLHVEQIVDRLLA
jgi:aspartate racemase